MNNQQATVRVFALLVLGTATSTVTAQPDSRFSAFMSCFNADGSAGLCTARSWYLVEGLSARRPGESATLESQYFTATTGEEICAESPVPAAIEAGLLVPDPAIGDRIYFDAFTIEAYDDNGNFLPEVPVRIEVLAQDGMLNAHSDEVYVEVASFGTASFVVSFYCQQLLTIGEELTFTVGP